MSIYDMCCYMYTSYRIIDPVAIALREGISLIPIEQLSDLIE